MSIFTAQIVVLSIAVVGLGVWLYGMRWRRAVARRTQTAEGELRSRFPGLEFAGGEWRHGEIEVVGRAEELLQRAADQLASTGLGANAPVRITRKTSQFLSFEPTTKQRYGKREAVPGLKHGMLRFTPLDSRRTRVDYAIDMTPARGLLRAAEILQYIGLIVLVGGYWALDAFAAPSEDPTIRYQVFQMFQVSHLLWPPFLCVARYQSACTDSQSRLEALVSNLEHVATR